MVAKFVYLIRAEGDQAPRTYIGMSSNPLERLREHNREPGYALGPKATSKPRGMWRLVMAIGPFKRGAKTFKTRWRSSSRMFANRVCSGYDLALEYISKGLAKLEVGADDMDETIRCIKQGRQRPKAVASCS